MNGASANTSSLLSLGDPRAAEGVFCGHRTAEGEDLVLESGNDWMPLWMRRAGCQDDLREFEVAKSYLKILTGAECRDYKKPGGGQSRRLLDRDDPSK
jgi:hypothetical protein